MSVGVIDLLKVVQVKHQKTGWGLGTAGALDFTLQQVEQCTPVPNSRRYVVSGLKAELFAGLNQTLLESEDTVSHSQPRPQLASV
jgi:hypothetical protein